MQAEHIQLQLRDAMTAAFTKELRRLLNANSITQAQYDLFDRAHITITLPVTLKNRGQ